jgi:DNA-binding response OmpR family regulator
VPLSLRRLTGSSLARPLPTPGVVVSTPTLTHTQHRLAFDIVLTGETRHRDALDVLDQVHRVVAQLGNGRASVQARHSVAALDAPVCIMPEARAVFVDGACVPFTRVEFDLLLFLAERPRRVFSRRELLRYVWGYEHTGERTVDVHIRRVRAKLNRPFATTVHRIGYRLAEDAEISVLREPE